MELRGARGALGGRLPAAPRAPASKLFTYFLQHFFKHNVKDSKKRRMKLATALWCNLSAEEKEKLRVKYEESRSAYEQDYADYLANMQPYLRKKQLQEPSLDNQHSEEQDNNMQIITNIDIYEADMSLQDHERPVLVDNVNSGRTGSPEPVEKPLPPPNDAKELFILTRQHAEDRQQCLQEWASLTSTQKTRYRDAVKTLKRDYLQKYKKYLSSLSPYELYQYWKENM